MDKLEKGTKLAIDHSPMDMLLQCLPEPLAPQYGGGILRNADFSAGLQGWSVFGYASVAQSVSATGNVFAVLVNRTRPFQSVSQKVYMQNDTHYTLSGTTIQMAHDALQSILRGLQFREWNN
jgi:hypothetical protein